VSLSNSDDSIFVVNVGFLCILNLTDGGDVNG
jgi:hypothetical protein